LPDPMTRAVRIVDVTAPALVLGSTQPAVASDDVDVVRRRSGGGAVLVRPGEVAWVDVLVPSGDPLWEDDIGRSFHWLGTAWVDALASLGVNGVMHTGAMVCTPWCRQVCFAGIGSGEVTVDGRKVVGLSQRRTRAGALFHCAALLRWDPAEIVRLLDLDESVVDEIEPLAAPLRLRAEEIEGALLRQLT
jgi:lipoate---protein ligase